eukprot:2591709-Prymnesium_polylepis.1
MPCHLRRRRRSRSGHGAGSTVSASDCCSSRSTMTGATARQQGRLRSGRCGRSGSGRRFSFSLSKALRSTTGR